MRTGSSYANATGVPPATFVTTVPDVDADVICAEIVAVRLVLIRGMRNTSACCVSGSLAVGSLSQSTGDSVAALTMSSTSRTRHVADAVSRHKTLRTTLETHAAKPVPTT